VKPRLIFSIPNEQKFEAMCAALDSENEQITFQNCTLDELKRRPEIDACFLTMMGAERWGSKSWSHGNFPKIHEAQVFLTDQNQREEGWPEYIIAGVPLDKDEDWRDWARCLHVIVTAVTKAALAFNSKGDLIRNVAMDGGLTCADKMSPDNAIAIIQAAYTDA